MAQVQTFKRIVAEDFEAQFRPLINKIGSSLNTYTDDVSNALNKGLTVEDNFTEFVQTITLTIDSTGSPLTSSQFQNTLNAALRGIIIIKVDNLTNPAVYPTQAPFITFSESNKLVTINHITGLQANNSWKVTIKAIG